MQSLGIFYKSVITDLLWTLLLSGALPSSYLSLRREAVLVSRRFSWKLSLDAEACNKLVRGSGEAQHSRIVSKSLVVVGSCPSWVSLGTAFAGFVVCTSWDFFAADSLLPVWDVGAKENPGASLALSFGFVCLLLAVQQGCLALFST